MHRGAGGLHLRRRDRADRKPRRQAGLAADQAAVSRRRRLFRKPTVVNNIETVACVTHIVDRGVDWFKSIGVPADPKNPRDPGSYGPKLYCLSGHVNKPGCYEAPLGITCRQLIDEYGGGVWKGRKAKAAIPGGISMGLLTEAEFDTPLDFAGPGKVGCLGLGTAAVVVLDETVSASSTSCTTVAGSFAHESCGQCTPCREGTAWSLTMLDRIKAGKGRLKDLDLLLEIGDTIGIIPGTTICGLADGAAWPIKNAIRKFRGEFEDYIRRTNPTGYMDDRGRPACRYWRIDRRLRASRDCRNSAALNTSSRAVASHGNRHRRRQRSRSRRRRAAQRHPGRRARGDRHSALLLASGPERRGQLPHVPGRNRHARRRDRARSRWCPSSCPACQTPAKDGTVFVTDSEKVRQSRAMVEEDLLIDHPIDCPICDKAGECYLQDYHFEHGQKERRADIRPLHQPPPRDGRHGHPVRRSLRDVQPLRPLHAARSPAPAS